MAVPAVAARLGQVAVKYAPQIQATASELLAKATNGRVTNVSELTKYVGNSPERMSIAANSLVRAGMSIDDVLPADLVGENVQLAKIREGALRLTGAFQNQLAAGSSKLITQTTDHIAADMFRRQAVEVALSVYGSANRYALCHPNGGIPVEDFVWYDRVVRGVKR